MFKWFIRFSFLLALCLMLNAEVTSATDQESGKLGKWIWHPDLDPHVTNCFTYFRKEFDLQTVVPDTAVLFAADSNARLIVNGKVLRRKVTRYHPKHVRPEKVLIGPFLKNGKNVILVLHHNWGKIKNFQRQELRRGGLLIKGLNDKSAIFTNSSWETAVAPQFIRHEQQIIGVIGDLRIRFPVIIDGSLIEENLSDVDYQPSQSMNWKNAVEIENPIWELEQDFYPHPQREYFFPVQRLLDAGTVKYGNSFSSDSSVMKKELSFPEQMENADYFRDDVLTQKYAGFPMGEDMVLQGKPGASYYLTFDFHQCWNASPTYQKLPFLLGIVN